MSDEELGKTTGDGEQKPEDFVASVESGEETQNIQISKHEVFVMEHLIRNEVRMVIEQLIAAQAKNPNHVKSLEIQIQNLLDLEKKINKGVDHFPR